MVKDVLGTKKKNILVPFFNILLFVLNNLPSYTIIPHYTIVKFYRFATIYCYLAYTFIWHSKVCMYLLSMHACVRA